VRGIPNLAFDILNAELNYENVGQSARRHRSRAFLRLRTFRRSMIRSPAGLVCSDTMRWQRLGGVMVGLGLVACGASDGRDDGFGPLGPGLGDGSGDETGPGSDTGATTAMADDEASAGSGLDSGDDESGEPPLPAQSCSYPSTSYGQGMQELDVPTGSTEVLSFTVPDVPDPASIDSATLELSSYDADHPGEEGVVWVNGQGPYDLPADAGWDNVTGSGAIDVTGALVQGLNTVEFGAGPLEPRSFYRIGDVSLEVQARVEACMEPEEPPPADAVPRELDYWAATYEMRHNWVLRCDGSFDYAYTAAGEDHIALDCEGLYDPDGTSRGTATWVFEDVVPATYEIRIHSRHTVNRNPLGALFIVNGEGIRIHQDDDADFTTDVWGTRELAGDVTVVLDSSQESESDSAAWIRLEPVAG
jgi:hypothetical protein